MVLSPTSAYGRSGFKEYPDRVPYQLSQINIPAGLGVQI